MSDWFADNAPQPASTAPDPAGDWFAQNAPRVAAPDQLPTIPLSPRAVPFRLQSSHPDTAIDKALEYTSGYEYDPGQMIVRGAQSIGSGVKKIGAGTVRTPEGREQIATGAHEAISGAMEAGTPLLPFGVAAAPVASVLGLGAGVAAQEGTTRGLKAVGVPGPYADVAGDVAGLAAGAGVGRLGHAVDTRLPLRGRPAPTPPTAPVPEPAPAVPPRVLTPPPVEEPPPPAGTSYHIPDAPTGIPAPTGLDNAIRAKEQLGPAAVTLPRRLTGVTPYQEHLLDTLGPETASRLPARLLEAQPEPGPMRPPPPAPPAVEPPVETRTPSMAPPEVAEESLPQKPAPPPIETVTTAPETPLPEAPAEPQPTATGPLAEPAYEPPKPPEPTPLEEPKPAPVMQAPQPEASVPMPPPAEPPPLPPQPPPAEPTPPPPPSQLPARKAPYSQRGAIDPNILTFGLADKFKGMNLDDLTDHIGGVSDRLRNFWGTSGLTGLGKAYEAGVAKESYPALRRLASPEAQARVHITNTMPKIDAALKGSGISRDAFLSTLGQDRLKGVGSRYLTMARTMEDATPAQLERAWNQWGKTVFSSIDEDLDLGITENAAKLLAEGEHKKLGSYLGRTFRWLANETSQNVMDIDAKSAAAHGKGYDQIVSTPEFHKALDIYKGNLESEFTKYHAMNDGFFSELGPLNTYFPLSKLREVDPAIRAQSPLRAALEKPDNPTNHFATGLAGAYDFSVEQMKNRLSQSIKSNGIAGFLGAIEKEGLGKLYKSGQEIKPMTINGVTYQPDELVRAPVKFPVSVKVGDQTKRLPSDVLVVPKWLAHEMKWNGQQGASARFGAFEPGKMSDDYLSKFAGSAIGLQLWGPAEAVLHTNSIARGYVGGTPFLGKGLLNRTIGNAPIFKGANALARLALDNNPLDPKNADLLREMAEGGYLHGRTFSSTISPALAESTGIPLKGKAHFSEALLFGPEGTDTRVRLGMAKAFKAAYPDVPLNSPAGARFMSQVIDYNKLTQAGIQSAVRDSALGRASAPFVSAGWTRIVNGLRGVTGMTPLPGKAYGVPFSKNVGLRLENQLTQGIAGLTLTWILAHRASSGKWPWDDPEARLFKIPVPGGIRNSAMGKKVWGDNPDPAFVDMTYSHPMAAMGAKEIGLSGAYDVAQAGGSGVQQGEEVARGTLNTALGTFLTGPVPQAGFGLFGVAPYLQSLTDPRTGATSPRLRQTTRTMETLPGQVAANVGGVIGHANPLIEPLAEGIGGMMGAPHMTAESQTDRGNKLVQGILRYAFPGAFVPTRSQAAVTRRLLRQQAGRQRQAGRERQAAERD